MERNFAEAARAYEKAAEVDRNSYGALCMLWDCRKTLGDEEEARRITGELLTRIEKAMQLYPDDAAAYAYGCYVLHNLGLNERALEWAQRAITIDPEDYNSHYNVACFLAAIGAVEKAIDTLEHCVPQLDIATIALDGAGRGYESSARSSALSGADRAPGDQFGEGGRPIRKRARRAAFWSLEPLSVWSCDDGFGSRFRVEQRHDRAKSGSSLSCLRTAVWEPFADARRRR